MPTFVLRPDIKKAYITSIIKVLSAVIFIILFVLLFNQFVGYDIFSYISQYFAIDIEPKIILAYFIFSVSVVAVIALAMNYAVLSNIKYEFQEQKLVLYNSVFLVLLRREEIPYDNMVYATYAQSFFDKILNTGTITISLRGMPKQAINLELIDNAVIYTSNINSLLERYKSIKAAETENELKVDKILSREIY